jgi:light-regulated signal transduction histidine kinase (bacteriophytochrome)
MTTPNDSDSLRREMQQFLYAVSHDLQEPFRKVRTFSQRLAAGLGEQLDEHARGDLERILSAAERGQGMIEGLLVLSRLETHAGPVTQVDLNETLAAVCEDLAEKIHSACAVISIEPLPIIRARADQMRLLFTSLLDNALKFQLVDIPASIRVFTEAPGTGPECRIVVEDNGIGLEEQYADRVFTVFQRLHPRDVYPGLGLGLAYCRKIVDRHQGSIRYQKGPENGTRFIVTLPV